MLLNLAGLPLAVTLALAFATSALAIHPYEIQGSTWSPTTKFTTLFQLTGTVTAKENVGFWIRGKPDGLIETSDSIYVDCSKGGCNTVDIAVGSNVVIKGDVKRV